MCAGRSSRANRGGPAGTGKQVTRRPLGVAVAIAEPERPVGHELGDGDLGERPGDGEQPRIVLDDPPDRVGGGHLQPPRLAQEHDPKRVVELGVGQDDALDRHMPDPGGGRRAEAAELRHGRRARR